MARGKGNGAGRPKKDLFQALPESFKDEVASKGPDQLHKLLSDIAKSEEVNKAAAKADKDLKEKREQASIACRSYKEASKLNDIKTKFVMRNLADKGDGVSSEFIRLSVDPA
jgi:hypothetical protein